MQLVRARGTAYERGAVIGAAFAGSVARSVAFNRRYLAAHGLTGGDLEEILTPYLSASEEALPDLVDQIHGMADGARQPFWDLFFANAFEEVDGVLEPEPSAPVLPERCTAVALRATGRTLLGHNEQWYAGDDGAVGIVFDLPDDGPALLAPVVAGTLPLVGLNEHGAAFGTMSLSAKDERIGIPRALVARSLLESSDRDDAYARATRDARAGGYSYLCAFSGGDTCVIESTASTAAVLDLDVHTNHALDPDVAQAAAEPSPGSRSRLSRAQVLAADTLASPDGLMVLLADHGADGQNICVHPDPADGEVGSTILFAMVCDTEARTMWVAAGHPCTGRFEQFSLDELARAQ